VEEGTEDANAGGFFGNFVRSRFMFGLGIAHGGIAGMKIDKQ